MTPLFITGSGTGIGKTLIAEVLARQIQERGDAVRVLKPVISGYDPDSVQSSDTGRLLKCVGRDITADSIAEISPWRFAAPLSPDMAAAREGRGIDFDSLIAHCREMRLTAERDGAQLLIEGVGGAMVPLTKRETTADWVAALDVPAAIVTGSYLGSISHALTALESLKVRNVRLAGIVISESPKSAAPLAEIAATLVRFAGKCPVFTVPRIAGENPAARIEVGLIPLLQ